MAGGHKHKFMHMNKYYPDYFGRHGFKRPQSVVASNITINIRTLDENIEKYIADGVAKKSGKVISIDLGELGFDKLLGVGTTKKTLNITVSSASKSAIEKIEASGGKVTLPGE